ncbi:MAG: Mut7-C RNAse domain-containing protein [Anaerolineales bacterium]
MAGEKTTTFAFDESLRFFLPASQRSGPLTLRHRERQSLKHLIESLGVPHTEVGEVLVNGRPVSLDEIAEDGDQVQVRAASPGCPIEEPRFLLDSHLGRLAAYLRMCGFDCLYANDYEDARLVEILTREERILLSRDRRLLMRKNVRHGYCLRSLEPRQQLYEVIRRFALGGQIVPFRRCLRCNALLEPVEKSAILHRLEPKTKRYFDEFVLCRTCDQIYWKGSHWEHMQTLLNSLSGLPSPTARPV